VPAFVEILHFVFNEQFVFLGILVSLREGFKGFEINSQGLLPLGKLFKFFPYNVFKFRAFGYFYMERCPALLLDIFLN